MKIYELLENRRTCGDHSLILHTADLLQPLCLTLLFLMGTGSFTSISESLESVILEADEGLSGGEESISRGPSLSFISDEGTAESWMKKKDENHRFIKVKNNPTIQDERNQTSPKSLNTVFKMCSV